MPDRKALLLWVCTMLLASCGGSQPQPSTVVLPAAVPAPDPPAPESTADAPKPAPPPPSHPLRGADTVGVRPLQSAAATKAEELFSEGKALMAAGAVPQACAKFEASNRIEPAMGTLLNLAVCEELAGHVFRACRFFREVVQLAQVRGQMERARYATERAARLGCSP